MAAFNSVEAVLKRAIVLEEEAATMYATAAAGVKNSAVRQRLEELVRQEQSHKAKLEDMLAGNVRWSIRRSRAEPVVDLQLSDHLEAQALEPNADYQDILLFAAKREKVAYEFYLAMAGLVDDILVKDVFSMLATEELRHKYQVEKTYEEVIYQAF